MPDSAETTRPQFLVHQDGDHVGVAVTQIEPGPAHGAVLASNGDVWVDVREAVPFGHKVALVERAEGDPVIEYGVQIGVAAGSISVGDSVHTHNLRSARWQSSVVS